MNESTTQPLILSRKSRISGRGGRSDGNNSFFDKLFRILYICLIMAVDLVMFVYSINGKLLDGSQYNQAAAVILGGMFAVSFLLILVLSFSRDAQNFLCALVTLLMTVVFLNQFALFDVSTFVETWLEEHASWLTFFCFIPSDWLMGLLLAVVVFFAFRSTLVTMFVSLMLLAIGVLGIRNYEFSERPQGAFSEIKGMNAKAGQNGSGKIVYFMVPKLPSYQLLNRISDHHLRELRDLLVGFYALNGFEVFPNAFIQRNDAMSNMIDTFNLVDYTSTKSGYRGYSEFVNNWEFIRGSLDYVNLEENVLFDTIKKNGYGISAYAMPGFNICVKGSDITTDRCVVKNADINFYYDNEKSVEKNVYTMLGEWVISFKMPILDSLAKLLMEQGDWRRLNVISDNHSKMQEGAPEVVDIVANDFVKDNGAQFYAVYVDLPGEEYIYDEFCNLKRREDWVALKNNRLYPASTDAKKAAYVEQAKCLLGKLQMYLDKLALNGKLDETEIIVQGVSSIPELAGNVAEKSGKFVKDKTVNLAIRHGSKPNFLVNANICLASDFIKSLLLKKEYCYSVDSLKMPVDERLSLKQNLINQTVIKDNAITDIAARYQQWYKRFYERNGGEAVGVSRVLMPAESAEPAAVVEQPEPENATEEVEVLLPADGEALPLPSSATLEPEADE